MNREIKFRAWDKTDKEMVKPEDVCIIPKREGGGQAMAGDGWRYDLMQYTGLKDKNGKEIYEGDIVEGYLCGNDKEPCETLVIEYQEFGSYDNSGVGFLFPDDSGDGGYLKIIGNIYDNPALLSQKGK